MRWIVEVVERYGDSEVGKAGSYTTIQKLSIYAIIVSREATSYHPRTQTLLVASAQSDQPHQSRCSTPSDHFCKWRSRFQP
jgi:hypothetical protein